MSDATVYVNHAGTSWPKPAMVQRAMLEVAEQDPGKWSEQFQLDHARLVRFFGGEDPSGLLLTPGGTSALSIAISDWELALGSRLVTSGWEHHAVQRPLLQRAAQGHEVHVLARKGRDLIDLAELQRELARGDVGGVVMTTACNVTGDLLPIDAVSELTRRYEVPLLLDASQTAGWLPLNLATCPAEMVAWAGHKGLQAPWGLGYLFARESVSFQTPAATCDVTAGGASGCGTRPGYCDAGSVNRFALAGAVAATQWLSRSEQQDRLARARQLTAQLEAELRGCASLKVVSQQPAEQRLPIVAVVPTDRPVSRWSEALQAAGVVVGAGFLCAPLAHQTLGTASQGVVRLSLGPMQTDEDVQAVVERIRATLAE